MIAEKLYDLLPAEWPKVIGDLPATSQEVVGIVEYDGATSTEYFGPADSSSVLAPIVKVVIRSCTSRVNSGQTLLKVLCIVIMMTRC